MDKNTVISQDFFIDLREKYDKVETLLKEANQDPQSEPFKSKYAALEILMELKSKLVNVLDDLRSSDSSYDELTAMLGGVWVSLGTISVDTEEWSNGEEQLTNCLKLLEDNSMEPNKILIVLSAFNQLGILWSNRGDYEKSQNYLSSAEDLYRNYKNTCEDRPKEVGDLFSTVNKPPPQTKYDAPLEKLHTLTLYYLAQIHATLGNVVKSAIYCHNTLRRQLECEKPDMIDWALNAATLAQFIMEKNAFQLARHHLAAASCVLEQYEITLGTNDLDEEQRGYLLEQYNHRSADVARCWAKYGIVLLSISFDRLTSDDYVDTSVTEPEFLELQFSTLELSTYESQITAKYVLVFDDAKKVFHNSLSWLNKAQEFYTLENHASDYVSIIQDMSELYKHLALFDDDNARKCKLHKKRIDMLEAVIKELNPKYYLNACRNLRYELAATYVTMFELKQEILQENSENQTPHAIKKIHHLISKAIEAYNGFLDVLNDLKTKKPPAEFGSDLVRPALLSYFYLGHLHSKLVIYNRERQLEHRKKSYEYYKMVVDYCDAHEEAKQCVEIELATCREMVELLPALINKLVGRGFS
ncbi:KIF-binding protein isoform X2 [Nilaparvata lugens]|uniref:KIF-binding protein isoform X2 n=1 Tax=Nilaparvata lugens TaxID=108931 RepID=UPI00193D0C88|nr:KIF-binding protein isoform X2 [Nilaparvata lugens]